MQKKETHWAVFNGEAILDKTLRRRKKDCLAAHRVMYTGRDYFWPAETVRKVVISPYSA